MSFAAFVLEIFGGIGDDANELINTIFKLQESKPPRKAECCTLVSSCLPAKCSVRCLILPVPNDMLPSDQSDNSLRANPMHTEPVPPIDPDIDITCTQPSSSSSPPCPTCCEQHYP
jgi:hypothetical protein